MSLAAAPPLVPVKDLLAKHPGYPGERASDLWRLYAGGNEFDARRFIRARRHEPLDIYNERCERAFYCGYIGEIIDSFVANLFLSEPSFTLRREDPFYQRLAVDCDRARTDLNAFHRDRWTRALAQGRSYTWIELPNAKAADSEETTVARLDEAGARDAYLIPVGVLDLLDFERDDAGAFKWATIYQQYLRRATPFTPDREMVHRWTILGTTEYAVYEAKQEAKREGDGWKPANDRGFLNKKAERKAFEPHPFGVVPLVELCIPDALALGEKLFDMQRAVTELDNAITWQQLMSLFAMPVVTSDHEFKQTLGEAYFIRLRQGDTFGWSEPAGTAIATSMVRRDGLKEEMFRIAHQMAQAIRSEAQTAGRSGESKRRDANPTQIILEYLGALARDHELEILRMVARGRQEDPDQLQFQVHGFDEFDVDDLDAWLASRATAALMPVSSKTFLKDCQKDLVRKLRPNATEEQLEAYDQEIDEAEIVLPGEEMDRFAGDVDPGPSSVQ